jgi:hypothetical protein
MRRGISKPSTLLSLIFFGLFLLYGIFEIGKVFLGPSLVINTPTNLSTVTNPLIVVSGKVARAAYVSLDDRQIYGDEKGNFSESLLLSPGYNIISIKVRDRFGKEISKVINVTYTTKI